MQVTYNGLAGELVKLERLPVAKGICAVNVISGKTIYQETKTLYTLSLYDKENEATYSFTNVKLEDIKYKTQYTPIFDQKPLENPAYVLLSYGRHLDIVQNVFCKDKGIIVHFEDCRIKNGEDFVYTYGEGATLWESCQDYLKKISGKTLVFNFNYGKREEITMPLFR